MNNSAANDMNVVSSQPTVELHSQEKDAYSEAEPISIHQLQAKIAKGVW